MPLVPHVSSGQIVASTWGNLVADHVVMRFTTAAQRASQLPTPIVDQLTTRDDRAGVIERWSGTAWVDLVPPRQLAYAELTASKNVTATVEASADIVLAAPSTTFDGGPVMVDAFFPAVLLPASAGALIFLWLFQDGASLGRLAAMQNPAAASASAPFHLARRLTPTAGAHTLAVAGTVNTGTAQVIGAGGGAGNYLPGYIRITRAA